MASAAPSYRFAQRALNVWSGCSAFIVLASLAYPRYSGFLMMAALLVLPASVGVCVWGLFLERTRSRFHRVAFYVSLAALLFLGSGIAMAASYLHFNAKILFAESSPAGNYVPDDWTKVWMEQNLPAPGADHRIELHGDGTFTMTGIPDYREFTATPKSLLTAKGTWENSPGLVSIKFTGADTVPPWSLPALKYSNDFKVASHPARLQLALGPPGAGPVLSFVRAK